MNVSASKHGADEVESWARALCLMSDLDPDQIIGSPEAPRWRSWESYARLSLLGRDLVASGAPLTASAPLDLWPK